MIKINGRKVETELFPNNETKVKDFKEHIFNTHNTLEFRYTDDASLIALWFVKKRIDELSNSCTLIIHYMPYSRMDRKIEGDLFTLSYTCNFINTLNFNKVVVIEPHSHATLDLLERSTAIYPVKAWLPEVMNDLNFSMNDSIVFPDKGAAARYANAGYQNVCVFEKKRNPATGKIESMTLKEGKITPGSKCIIIDDLCSAGGTFAWAGSILKEMGAANVVLVVTHCEATIFNGKLLDADSPIDAIYTSNSMTNKPHSKIKYMNINFEDHA